MKYLKEASLITLITLFLFVCGSLYLVGFWSTFNIQISNMIDIGEIPKSFIMPFVVSNATALLFFISITITSNSKKDELIPNTDQTPLFNSNILIVLDMILNFLIGIGFASILALFNNYHMTSQYWTVSGATMSVLISLKLVGLAAFKKLIPNDSIRVYLANILVTTIIMSGCLGKAASVKIYTNELIKYIKASSTNTNMQIQATNDSTRLKLLGFLGNKVIVSSLDNKKIYILKQDAIDVLEIEVSEEDK